MSFWYLATPYSRHPEGLLGAFRQACEQSALLLKAGVPIFCPIAHSHAIAQWSDIDPRLHDFWLAVDKPFMDAAKGLIVCRLDSWESSKGVAAEIEAFKAAKKPVVYMQPGIVPREVLCAPHNS